SLATDRARVQDEHAAYGERERQRRPQGSLESGRTRWSFADPLDAIAVRCDEEALAVLEVDAAGAIRRDERSDPLEASADEPWAVVDRRQRQRRQQRSTRARRSRHFVAADWEVAPELQ